MPIKTKIRTIANYPKPGILFRDITTLLSDPISFNDVVTQLKARYQHQAIAKIAAIESRGFIIGSALAFALNAGFIPIRKKGKLPWEKISHDYQLEYGMDTIEIHIDAIKPQEKVLLIDDIIATGGTAEAATQLINRLGGDLVECCFVIDLPALGGRQRLEQLGHKVYSLCEFMS